MAAEVKQGNKTFHVEAVFYYQVQCRRCRGLSPPAPSPADAVELALESGWREMWDGGMICALCDDGGMIWALCDDGGEA